MVAVVLRRHLDQISADDVQAGEPAQEGLHFPDSQSPDFRCSRSRCKGRVDAIDIACDIYPPIANDLSCFRDDHFNTVFIDVFCVDDRHPRFVRKLPQVFRRAANADLDGACRVDHTFKDCMAERSAMMKLASVERPARVAMRINMDQSNGFALSQRAKNRQRNGMVSTDRDRHNTGVHDTSYGLLDVPVTLEKIET
ncbi:hypothetical protein WL94_16525 [Burkholderia cepacia]|nr:hypothetical protein WL94_16525 [Burkholderia cepacia]